MKAILTTLTEENKAAVYEQIIDPIWDKCRDGFALDQLNAFEKPLIIAQIIEDSINGGGINSYFYNTCNKYVADGLAAFQTLGMTHVYDIFKQAVDAFPASEIPGDLETCRQLMEALPDENPTDEKWSALTDAFYDLHGYILDKKLEYIRESMERG